MTDEGRLPNEESNYESRSNSSGWTGIPRPLPGAREVLVVVKAAGVGPWHRLARD
jgi:NADPH:quinone reductase-like Zn-dependent oxidoreductase